MRAGQGCQPLSLALRTQGLCTSPALIAQENEPISSPPAGTKLVRLGDEGSCRLFANSLIAFLPPAISPPAHTRTSLHVSNSVTEGKKFPSDGVKATVMEGLTVSSLVSYSPVVGFVHEFVLLSVCLAFSWFS